MGLGGPLAGVKVLELAGLGALPYGSLRLAEMGAEVFRIDRLSDVASEKSAQGDTLWNRGRRLVAVDLKHPAGVEVVLRLSERVDVFLEAFRPGVVERLGVGPNDVMARNPKVVYGRLTGWGQNGVLSHSAGHSLNYEAITGLIRSVGPHGGAPVPQLNVHGDFAGGGLTMAYGVVCALLETRQSNVGQVLDVAMVDGAASLAGMFYPLAASGAYSEDLGTNLLDGGAPFYAIYECADGGYMSVAPLEPHFWSLFLSLIGVDESELPPQYDRDGWPLVKARLAKVFASKSRGEWCEILECTDACCAPVLTFNEARAYQHNVDRQTFVGADGTEVAPVPRFSRTPGESKLAPAWVGADTDKVLTEFGFSQNEITHLRSVKAIDG